MPAGLALLLGLSPPAQHGCPTAPAGYSAYPNHCVGPSCASSHCDCGATLRMETGCAAVAACVEAASAACAGDPRCASFGVLAGGDNCSLTSAGKWQTFAAAAGGVVPNGEWVSYARDGVPTPPPAPPPGACATDHDCSLNGVCTDARCVCDVPWSGPSCGVIVRKKSPLPGGGMYGYAPNVSSWGGNVVKGDDGKYHLYVAEMATGGLKGWGSQSECRHAVSDTREGPYAPADLAIGKWCHNPSTLRDPKTGEYLLFHIGNTNGSGYMHHASSPTGPWAPAGTSPGSCNNPAPAFHPNGTLFNVCNHMKITYALGGWGDVYAPQRGLTHGPGSDTDHDRHWEDPELWFDRRGNWHIVYHVYCLKPYSAHKECTSGHAFSADGFVWTFSPVEPFDGTVDFTDGGSITFSTRERPKFIYADEKRTTPVGVITGSSSQPISSACDTCSEHACSQCKVTAGRDWTYTVFQPFEGF